uniref:DNA methyltransferase n=1 Tax=Accumulibacter sp. TaxID=2053492 RepID=UPI0035B1B223
RTRSAGLPPSPILRDFRNIACGDAVLAYGERQLVTDANGQPLTRWDGITTKAHPVTGEAVPDEAARIPLWRYPEARPAEWPAADFIVGNPPFIGAKYMRSALGDGYVDALRATWPEVPESADYVMFWWHAAARRVLAGQAERFGFITTNSLTQTFNRRVVQAALDHGLSLAFAIPDHPWVDSADGAAVRIAMTVGSATENGPGQLSTVESEVEAGGEGLAVTLKRETGSLHADLRIGANVAAARALRANGGISSPGFKLHGAGFIVTPDEAAGLEADAPIKDYRNGRDLTDRPRGVKLIDLFGLTAEDVRRRYPATYQRVLERVKPERDQNARATYRDNWWIFGEPRRELRPMLAGLPRYIATVVTAKHRVFQFLDADVAPDDALMCFGFDDAYLLGVLSSTVHERWMLATGSTLEDRPRYIKSACFETFPFPAATPEQQARIGDLAEQLDAHRKTRQAADPALTLTGMYNVLEKLKAGEALNAREKAIHQSGLVGVLATLHAELDAAVLAAYGWSDLAADATPADAEAILVRLVALNAERQHEEAAGHVRWLRPAFQNPPTESAAVNGKKSQKSKSASDDSAAPAAGKTAWPATLPEQMALLARLLAATPQSEAQLAALITGKGPWKKRLPDLLQTLAALGRARREGESWVAA